MKEKIVKVIKDNLDRPILFRTNKRKIYDYETAIDLINDHKISNAGVYFNKYGLRIIKINK